MIYIYVGLWLFIGILIPFLFLVIMSYRDEQAFTIGALLCSIVSAPLGLLWVPIGIIAGIWILMMDVFRCELMDFAIFDFNKKRTDLE